MSYNDILNSVKRINKEKVQSVFSDIIGETKETGRLVEFIKDSEAHLTGQMEETISPKDSYLKKEMTTLIDKFKNYSESKFKWLTYMGLLERKIMQQRLYRNIQISYSTQLQKSGENKFSYILLRAPFIDIFTGKKEIRVYYNKLEDYPNYKSIEELKNDINFKIKAAEKIREEMDKQINNENMSLEKLFKELENSEQYELMQFQQMNLELKMRCERLIAENYKLKEEIEAKKL
jgi:hypothetical protein